MPLPGGPSSKFGNRYELWWTVSQLVRIINKQAESIRIENPTIDKAEFVITAEGRQEFHQAKRSHPSGKWNLSFLQSLLQTMFEQLSANNNAHFVFVSGSDTPELRELTERATNAKESSRIRVSLCQRQSQKASISKNSEDYWQDADTATAYAMLQRIKVRTIDEQWD